MNTIAWISLIAIVLVIVFDTGFVVGAWWASREKEQQKIYNNSFAKFELDRPETIVCKRCGVRYDTESSESVVLCQHCVNELKANQDDEYFKQEIYK